MSGIMNMFVAAKTTVATAVDAFFNSVSLLLNTSSTNGAQNNTFLDSSTNNFTITRNGNTTQGTFTPFSQTGWSNYFTTSDGLSIGTAVTVGNTWTLECFFTVQQTGQTILVNGNGATGDPWIGLNGGYVYFSFGGTTRTFLAPYSLYTWYHLALTCNAGTVTVYLNGVQQDATQASPTSNFTVNRIGGYNGGGSNAWNGYISNLRITNTVVYSSAFTPSTTPLTAISGTALLTCQSNRFVDNSTNGYAITINAGTPSVQAFSPFLPTAAYDAAVVGGSGYFDGSGDFLSAGTSLFNFTTANASTQTATIEAWVYTSAYGSPSQPYYSECIICKGDVYLDFGINGSGNLILTHFDGTQRSVTSSGTVPLNTWTYVACTISGGVVTLYINGSSSGTGTWYGIAAAGQNSTSQIGLSTASGGLGVYFTGYISNIRVSSNVRSISIPTAPYSNDGNTSFLLSVTNAGIYDSAAKNVLETVGNAQVSTTQAKWGTTSMYFDGTGDWLITPNGRNYINGTEPFTIECWVYVTGTPSYWSICGAASGTLVLTIQNLTTININPYGSGNTISVTTSLSTNTWTHIAATRDSSNRFDIWVNGVSAGNATSSQSFGSPTNYVIGAADSGGTQSFNGYIDDLRISKFCRYTTTFTPPTAAFPLQ
jgi:hypothetical protein